MNLLKYKQTSTPTINIAVSNKLIPNNHQLTHKKQPTLDNLNSLSNIKIKPQLDKLPPGNKTGEHSFGLNTSQSNECPSPMLKTPPSSVTNLIQQQSKVMESKLSQKNKKPSNNP